MILMGLATGIPRSATQVLHSVVRAVVWVAATIGLGLLSLRSLLRLRSIFATSVRCPRGHVVELLSVWRCARCGSRYEGSAWRRCPACGAEAGRVDCPKCALAVHRRFWL